MNSENTINTKNKLIFIYNVYNLLLRFYLLTKSFFTIEIVITQLKILKKHIYLNDFNLHYFI